MFRHRHTLYLIIKPALSVYGASSQKGDYSNFHHERNWHSTTASLFVTLLSNSSRKEDWIAQNMEIFAKEGGLQAERCLSEPSLSPLPREAEEKKVGDVKATGLISVCRNGYRPIEGHKITS